MMCASLCAVASNPATHNFQALVLHVITLLNDGTGQGSQLVVGVLLLLLYQLTPCSQH
jgi:hypothetical protein